MEVLHDGKFNLIETENLIVKNMLNYPIKIDTHLNEFQSGALYLVDNSANNIIIYLPYRKNGLNFNFIFTNNSNYSIEFRTSPNPIDNSKIIGTDWLYLKRSNINISYNSLTGSIIKFNKSEKGENIKFYSDDNNFYIINKNDTNNNINNIIQSFPSDIITTYLVNINLNNNNSYNYTIINENTGNVIDTIFMGTNYNFKINTSSIEYNTITKLSDNINYELYTYIEKYDYIDYNISAYFDTNQNKFILDNSNIKYRYKYPVLNYYLLDINKNKYSSLKLLPTKYTIDIYNNSILYPNYSYNSEINNDINNQNLLQSNTSILNIHYNTVNNNLVIYDENNNIVYDHNNDRRFLGINRDIKYTLNYYIINNNYDSLKLYTPSTANTSFKFFINTLNSDISLLTYSQNNYFKFTDSISENNTFIVSIPKLDNTQAQKNIYYLILKYDEPVNLSEKKIFIVPLLFLDHILLETQSNSNINFSKINKNLTNSLITTSYELNIISSTSITTNDIIHLKLNNTNYTDISFNSINIFNLITQTLKFNLESDNIDNYLLKFQDNDKKIYNTTITNSGIFKIFNLNTNYENKDNIVVNFYSELNNITGGVFNIKPFTIDDSYSGKVILINLNNKDNNIVNVKFDNLIQGNTFEFVINDDNSIDSDTYKLTKRANSNGYEEYYFIKNSNNTNLLKTITLYTSNSYKIEIDRDTIKENDIGQNLSLLADLFQFSDIEDATFNLRKSQYYNFITKNISTNNSISYIINIPEFDFPDKLYYYNKTIKKMGGFINIKSKNDLYNDLQITSVHPFTLEYKHYINNISYEKLNNTHILTLKKLNKGSSIKFYFHNNHFVIKDFNFSNKINIIDYPDNIISTNQLNTKFILNNNKYDISFVNKYNHVINYLTKDFKLIKNQNYYISQSDLSNYDLEPNSNKDFYIKLNNNLEFEFYNDSKFQLLNSAPVLYRKNTYFFNQYHRSNFNPGIDIDLKQIFKVTLKKNTNNIYTYHINNLETYNINIIKNVPYYFDLSEVYTSEFRISQYSDGLNNNSLTEYNNSSDVTYKYITINNINYINLIILKINSQSTLNQLFYYSNKIRSIGGNINIVNSQFNYNLYIKEKKTYSNNHFFMKKHLPTYTLEIKDQTNTNIINSLPICKNQLFSDLSYKLNFDRTIYNSAYNQDSDNTTILIYVKLVYDSSTQIINPKLAYFNFYQDISFNNKINLPLTLLKNKNYKFIQPNYMNDIFKFYIFINESSSNYVHNIDTSNFFDINIITKNSNSGITLNTSNLYTNYLYYSGIHYTNSNLYSGQAINNLNNHDCLINTNKICIISSKNIYLSDKIENNSTILNDILLTDSTSLLNKNYIITQTQLINSNILNDDISNFYLQNKINTTSNISISVVLDNNNNYSSISKLNNSNIFISSGSNYAYVLWDHQKNKAININTNTQYSIILNNSSTTNTDIYKLCYYDKTTNQLVNSSTNIININSSTPYVTDYFICNTSTTNTYANNNNTSLFTFTDVSPSSISSNFYNINIATNENIYEYFITFKNDLASFKLNLSLFGATYTVHSVFKYSDYNTTKTNIDLSNNIDITNDTLFYIDIHLVKNNTDLKYIYHFICFKESTIYSNIVDFGKLYINDLDNKFEIVNHLYKSQPIKFDLSDNLNQNLPNSKLINEYKIELLATEFYQESDFPFETSKYFNINTDYYSNTKTTDKIQIRNVFSNNIYVNDFRTLYFDISHASLLNQNIIFYTDEKAITKLESNIIYSGQAGIANSKVIINIDPKLHGILYFYSDCLYESKINYNMIIKNTDLEIINTNSNADKKFKYKYKYKYNIINYLDNKDIYYYFDNSNTTSYINFNKCYFILYNNSNIYSGTVYSSIESVVTQNILKNIYLVFDELKFYNNNQICIDNTYTIKFFNHKPGRIVTPNYIKFDKLNNSASISSSFQDIYNESSDLYLFNNHPINYLNESYLKFDSNNNEKYYIDKNVNESFNIKNSQNQSINISDNISLSNYVIYDNTTSIFKINSNPPGLLNTNKHYYTRLNNNLNFIHPSTIYNQNTLNERSINSFYMYINIYQTYYHSNVDYYSMDVNLNGIENMILTLKPYHSYNFNIHKNIVHKINNNSYVSSYVENNIEKYFKLSIVNIDDTVKLYSSTTGELNINLPYTSDNKLYLKVECYIKNKINNERLKQGFFNRENTNITTSELFSHYIPIFVDKKSLIQQSIKYTDNYYIDNYLNSLHIYNNYTYVFDISNLTTLNNVVFSLINKFNETNESNSSYLQIDTNKIILYTNNNHNLSITSNSNKLYLYYKNSEIKNENSILLLNNQYYGNYSNPSDESNYLIKYIGSPGYDGQLIYNVNKTLDFNININDKSQNNLYVNYNVYSNIKNILYKYIYDLYTTKTRYISLFEPIKLKIEYLTVDVLNQTKLNSFDFSYSNNFFPGKPNSNIILQIPKDLGNDEILSENLRFSGVGYYSNKLISNINTLDLLADIYTLQQQNSTIFINVKNNIIIRLPNPNYSYKYKFIISDSIDKYNITFMSENDIFINNNISPNIILDNNTLIFNKLVKGNSFTITSNNKNYFLDNISFISNYDTNSIQVLPEKKINTLKVFLENEKFNIKSFNNILYKDKLYNFNRLLLEKPENFELYNPNLDISLDLSKNVKINEYNNLYYILQKNTITNGLFTNFIANKTTINYKVTYNASLNKILFNNSSEPILYSNYLYNFDISSISDFYILHNSQLNSVHSLNISDNKFVNIYNNLSNIYLILNDQVVSDSVKSFNNIFYNQILYYKYNSLVIDKNNNELIINEFDGLTTHEIKLNISDSDYGTYNFLIDTTTFQLKNNLIDVLNKVLRTNSRGVFFSFSIINNRIVLTHSSNNFNISKNNLYTTLNFGNNNTSNNKKLEGDIKYIRNNFKVDFFYNYYGNKLYLNHYQLNNQYTSNKITVDLIDHNHLELPSIKENNQYTIVLNNTVKNKYLYIHSKNNINYNNNVSNIVVLKPLINKNIPKGAYINIISSDNEYIIFDYKNIDLIEYHSVYIYNKQSNICNLHFTDKSLTMIDKYISIFGIHLIGLKSSKKDESEQKLLHVARVLSKLFDFNENKKPDDINIVNTLLKHNSYIILYDNILPNFDLVDKTKHTHGININYSDININYDYNNYISSNNKYDCTLKELLKLLLFSYIESYPHNFKYNFNSSSDLYKYIKYGNVNSSDILILDNRTTKTNIKMSDLYYDSSKIVNWNDSNGVNLEIRINKFETNYDLLNHTIKYLDIEITNIGNGYKNNDVVRIQLSSDLFIYITLKLSSISYNVKSSHNEVFNKHLNTSVFNELINNKNYNINTKEYGLITNDINNTRTHTSIPYNNILYNQTLQTDNDSINYLSDLLLGLLGYYKKRYQKNNPMTNLNNSVLITPTLIEKFNKSFVSLYRTSSLVNINSLDKIKSYDLGNINYIKSNNANISDIIINVSNQSQIEFVNIIKTYDNILFDNYLDCNIITESQFSKVTVTANIVENTVKTAIIPNMIEKNRFLIDTSKILSSDYNTKTIEIIINNESEDNSSNVSYTINARRSSQLSIDNAIDNIKTKYEYESKIYTHQVVNKFENYQKIFYDYKIVSNNVRTFIVETQLKNIYSESTITFSNNDTSVVNNSDFIKSYTLTTKFDVVIMNIGVKSENNSESNYIFYLVRKPHNIAYLSNIEISNVSYLQKFYKYNYLYSGLVNVNNNFTIKINKVDKFSNIVATVEYYSTYYHSIHEVYNKSHNLIDIPSIKYVIDNNLLNGNPTLTSIKHIKVNIQSISEDYSKKINYTYILNVYKPVILAANYIY